MVQSLDAHGEWATWLALAWLIAILAAYVSLDCARRVRAARPHAALFWLVASGLGLGTGVWSAQAISVAAESLPVALGYHPLGALAAWGLAIAVSMGGLGLVGGPVVTLGRIAVGGCALGAGIVASQMVAMQSMGLRPGIAWHLAPLGFAGLAAAGGCVIATVLFFKLRARLDRGKLLLQGLAALILAVAVVFSQHLVLAAAELASTRGSAPEARLPLPALTMLASIGSIALLSIMLLACVLEAQLRASLRRAKDELQKTSLTDPLTELPNRLMFEDALAQAVQRADDHKERLALLFINLDGFKPINETFGHTSGDRMLRDLGARLRALARPQDSVARLGGDEFLMLLTGNPRPDAAARLAAELLEALSQPCNLNGREGGVSCSIGIAMYPEHGAMSTLIAHADAAMRAAKSTGGATYCFFEARMMNGAREQVALLRDLRRALADGQLELFYQPKIHAPSGEITGAEALMRWHHPQRGLVSPGVFIPIAERYGLIVALGNWLIDEACRQARVWRDQGLRMRVAINLSVYQLRQPDLADRIAGALQRHQINPKLLTCEITESVAMEDAEGTMKIFEALAAVGVHISIDDFGTGYSSLSYLRKLPAEELKIDRSFVLDLETSSDARSVVDAVIKLAHALGLKVVAEGVETEAQNQILRSLGCHELQGFLFAKPMSAKALALWAMADVGPRPLDFRDSLFKETEPAPMH